MKTETNRPSVMLHIHKPTLNSLNCTTDFQMDNNSP